MHVARAFDLHLDIVECGTLARNAGASDGNCRFSPLDLLNEVAVIDLGQQLSFTDAVRTVDHNALKVSIGARQDLNLAIWLEFAHGFEPRFENVRLRLRNIDKKTHHAASTTHARAAARRAGFARLLIQAEPDQRRE
jgi:hypothetical protein